MEVSEKQGDKPFDTEMGGRGDTGRGEAATGRLSDHDRHSGRRGPFAASRNPGK